MSKTDPNGWETVSVTAIPRGIEVVPKSNDKGEILFPAIAILHQTLFSEESVTERIVLGILDVRTGEISAAEPDTVASPASRPGRADDRRDADQDDLGR